MGGEFAAASKHGRQSARVVMLASFAKAGLRPLSAELPREAEFARPCDVGQHAKLRRSWLQSVVNGVDIALGGEAAKARSFPAEKP